MKSITVNLEFKDLEEMQEFFAGRTSSVSIAAQTFGATTHEVAAPKKVAPKKAVEVKKEVEIVAPTPSVPTSAFPTKPAAPISPLPKGMPLPTEIPTPNYGAPIAHVNVAPLWNKEAAVAEVKAMAEASGKDGDEIRRIFSSVFQEQSITPGPLGQLSDGDVYKFQQSFRIKVSNPQHLA